MKQRVLAVRNYPDTREVIFLTQENRCGNCIAAIRQCELCETRQALARSEALRTQRADEMSATIQKLEIETKGLKEQIERLRASSKETDECLRQGLVWHDDLLALTATLPKCVRGCRRLATTTDGDGAYHCDPHRPPSELTVSVDLPWANLVREEKISVQP